MRSPTTTPPRRRGRRKGQPVGGDRSGAFAALLQIDAFGPTCRDAGLVFLDEVGGLRIWQKKRAVNSEQASV